LYSAAIYILEPERRKQVFALAISLVREAKVLYEHSVYIMLVYSLVISDVVLKEAICRVSKQLVSSVAGLLSGSSSINLCAQSHVSSYYPLTLMW
jgi:hypothetical protein